MNRDKIISICYEQEVLGRNFKMYGDLENPLFLARDVADWLEERDGYTVSRKVDEDEKVTHIVCTLGGNQVSTFLTEDGFYEVLMQSRKQKIKPFKKQVKQILRQIRKTGVYIPVGETKEETLQNAIEGTEKTLEHQDEFLKNKKEIERLTKENKSLQSSINRKTRELKEVKNKINNMEIIMKNADGGSGDWYRFDEAVSTYNLDREFSYWFIHKQWVDMSDILPKVKVENGFKVRYTLDGILWVSQKGIGLLRNAKTRYETKKLKENAKKGKSFSELF